MKRKEHPNFFFNLYIQLSKWFLMERKINGHYRITFNYLKVFLVLLFLIALISLFSRNIDKQDIFKDKQNVIAGPLLFLVLLSLIGFIIIMFQSTLFVLFQGVF
tara:strand:+ start:3515 stop:3826 length:312 start_codon:yes stop_codon:yes gene_type:complete